MDPSPKITRVRPPHLRDARQSSSNMSHSISLSLENLENWDLELEAAASSSTISGPSSLSPRIGCGTGGGGGREGVGGSRRQQPHASTPISDAHNTPFDSIPCSPVRDLNMMDRRPVIVTVGLSPQHCVSPMMYRPLSARLPGALPGPRPIRAPPPALGPKWRLFKRKTCPELLKTRSTDNLFR